jgi:hypothetical protein
MGKRVDSISLGQGQGKKAYALVIDNSHKRRMGFTSKLPFGCQLDA